MSFLEVSVFNSTSFKFSKNQVVKEVKKLAQKCRFKKPVFISLSFVGIKRAKFLNLKYRKANYIPEVLTFSHLEAKDDFLVFEIFLCPQAIKKRAQSEKKSLNLILKEDLKHAFSYIC